jgi:hypothetical protein
MNRTGWLVGVWLLLALPFVGCGGGSNAPEGAGLKGMDDPASFQNAAAVPPIDSTAK